MLIANSSLKILKPCNIGSNNVIRCFGSDVGNIIRVQSNIKILKSTDKQSQYLGQQPTQSSLYKENIPGYSDLSVAENGYKMRILDNLVKKQIIYQSYVFPQQRNVVVNYLILLHRKMELNLDSLYLSITLLNRSLPTFIKNNFDDFELIAITCLWMSSKIQQTRVPSVRFWTKFGKGFQAQQLISMEQQILGILEYETICPTPISFLNVFHILLNISNSSKEAILSQYILQISLLHPQLLKYSDCLVAISSIYLSFKIVGKQWKEQMNQLINMDNCIIKNCSRQLSKCLQIDTREKNSAVYRKYLSHKYKSISNIRLGRKSDPQK